LGDQDGAEEGEGEAEVFHDELGLMCV